MNKLLLLIAATLMLNVGCTSSKKDTPKNEIDKTKSFSHYVIDLTSTSTKWTAYKYTKRAGVSGVFNNLEVQRGSDSTSKLGIMKGLHFSIPISSVNSKNEDRDGKIVRLFFGTMLDTKNITGSITSVRGNDSIGVARINIRMNGNNHEVDANYTIQGTKLVLKCNIHLGDWKAEPSVTALNKECKDLHTGEDGISKLWPDVDILIESNLIEVSYH